MSDEEKRWPFDGFYLKLAEAQREYEQEQHIDPASLTEEERQQKLQEILDCIKASRKKKKEADEQLDPIVPEEEPETAGATPQPAKQLTIIRAIDIKNTIQRDIYLQRYSVCAHFQYMSSSVKL